MNMKNLKNFEKFEKKCFFKLKTNLKIVSIFVRTVQRLSLYFQVIFFHGMASND